MKLVKNNLGSMFLSGNRQRLLRVKRRAPGRCHFLSALLLGFVCAPLGAAQLAEHRAQDLDYGRALYQFFQNDNLGAITQLKIAEQRAGTGTQQDEANLLLADLYLDYGLYEESRELFSRRLTAEISVPSS